MLREKLSILKEELGYGTCILAKLPENLSTEISRGVAREIHRVLSDDNKLKVLGACEDLEHRVESLLIVGEGYKRFSGIRNHLLFPRENYRARFSYKVAEVLFPEGNPRDLEMQEQFRKAYPNFYPEEE